MTSRKGNVRQKRLSPIKCRGRLKGNNPKLAQQCGGKTTELQNMWVGPSAKLQKKKVQLTLSYCTVINGRHSLLSYSYIEMVRYYILPRDSHSKTLDRWAIPQVTE